MNTQSCVSIFEITQSKSSLKPETWQTRTTKVLEARAGRRAKVAKHEF